MKHWWTTIWRSRSRSIIAGLLISALIASVLYSFNWHTFYSTRTNLAYQRAERIFADIHAIALHTASHPDHDQNFRAALRDYADHRRTRITVSRLSPQPGAEPLWQQSNEVEIDQRRTLVDSVHELSEPDPAVGGEVGGRLRVQVEEAVRPPLYLALARAWTFSIADYLDDPQRWHKEVLYNRSMPLYGYLFTILLVGFGTIRAFHRDQLELDRLQSDAKHATAALDRQRQLSRDQIDALREQIAHDQRQQQQAEQQQQRLQAELEQIDSEYQQLLKNTPDTTTGTSPAISDDSDEHQRLQDNQQRRSKTLQALASYNHSVAEHQQRAEHARAEMLAAEQLLTDVETQRQELSNKVTSSNREIQRLRSLLQDIEKRQRAEPSPGPVANDAEVSAIEQQLSQWINSSGQVNMSFSQHHGVGELQQQAAKVDSAFLDRFFSHVTNPEYGRGAHKTIRVVTDGDDRNGGELIVALDDAKRRTLGFRYQTRGNAPPAAHIGFVLALLLRHYCRDFRGFSIRVR